MDQSDTIMLEGECQIGVDELDLSGIIWQGGSKSDSLLRTPKETYTFTFIFQESIQFGYTVMKVNYNPPLGVEVIREFQEFQEFETTQINFKRRKRVAKIKKRKMSDRRAFILFRTQSLHAQ